MDGRVQCFHMCMVSFVFKYSFTHQTAHDDMVAQSQPQKQLLYYIGASTKKRLRNLIYYYI